MSTVALLPVKNAAAALASANTHLVEAMRTAKEEGASLREIAVAADISHEAVRRFVA